MPRSLVPSRKPRPQGGRYLKLSSEIQLKRFLIVTFLIAFSNAAGAVENPLSISVLKAERSGRNSTYLLFSVENASDQKFEWTNWSCVFFNGGSPAYEERSTIENVPPRGRAIQRIIQAYGGPFDKIECRFMRSRPSTSP